MKSRLPVSFGGVADRERKHLGKKASGIRGARAPGQRIDQAFLGRLARGTKPGPIVPTPGKLEIFKNGKMIIIIINCHNGSGKPKKFSGSWMTKWTAPLNSSREI